MIKEILRSIEGVEIYPIISLLIFFAFFIVMAIWLIKMDKNRITKMKNIPFNNGDKLNINSGEQNEKNN
jgi:hypothetical protein